MKKVTVPTIQKSSLSLEWECYSTPSELPMLDQKALARAKNSLLHSHSPYSNFKVGAGIYLANGAFLGGSNQENASYPLCLCAERVALAAAAVVYPNVVIHTMAVTVKHPDKVIDKPAMPCGACRQVICEVEQKQQHPIRIITQGETGVVHVFKSGLAILPLAFDASYL